MPLPRPGRMPAALGGNRTESRMPSPPIYSQDLTRSDSLGEGPSPRAPPRPGPWGALCQASVDQHRITLQGAVSLNPQDALDVVLVERDGRGHDAQV